MSDPTPAVDPAVLYEHLNPMEGGKAYLSEEFRLACCLADAPTTQITPQVLCDTPEYASVEVAIMMPDRPPSIRHGSASVREKRMHDRDGNPKGRLLEVAETRGIGRALVPLGYGTAEVLARLGVTPAQVADVLRRKAAERADSRSDTRAGGGGGRGISDGQVKAIYAIGRTQRHWSDAETDAATVARWGRPLGELTSRQASDWIDLLRSDTALPAPEAAARPPASGPRSPAPAATAAPAGTGTSISASAEDPDGLPAPAAVRPNQLVAIRALLGPAGLTEAALCEKLHVARLEDLPATRALKTTDWLVEQANKARARQKGGQAA